MSLEAPFLRVLWKATRSPLRSHTIPMFLDSPSVTIIASEVVGSRRKTWENSLPPASMVNASSGPPVRRATWPTGSPKNVTWERAPPGMATR